MTEGSRKQSETAEDARLGKWNDVEGHPEWFWGVGTIGLHGDLEAVVVDRATGKEIFSFRFFPGLEDRYTALARVLAERTNG